jgi:hypothetical protein
MTVLNTELLGGSAGKGDILGGDRIGHCEKKKLFDSTEKRAL